MTMEGKRCPGCGKEIEEWQEVCEECLEAEAWEEYLSGLGSEKPKEV